MSNLLRVMGLDSKSGCYSNTGGRRLLNALNIPKGRLNQRLQEFAKQKPDLANMLLGLKWLGNEASHSEISKEDILLGYEVFDHVLNELYIHPVNHQRIMQLSQELHKRYNPGSRNDKE